MTRFFLACALLGGGVLAVQLAFALFGLEHHDADITGGGHGHDAHASEGLNFLGVRALATGLALFGFVGYGALAIGVPLWGTLLAALVGGAAGAVTIAMLMRSLLRLESDGVARIERAVGLPGTVYLRVPGERGGVGKVQLTLQHRTVEYQAVTARQELLTGTEVVIVDVLGPDTVEVIATPNDGEIFDASL